MANLFESANYPTVEPGLAEYDNPIVAGNTINWKKTTLYSDYPNSAYAIAYQATLNGTPGTSFTVTGSVTSEEWIFSITHSDSASITPGIYQWNLYVTKSASSERKVLDSGVWEVVPNISTNTSVDVQSHARKVLSAVEAVIEGRASQDQMSYSIAGRSLSRMSIQDLMFFRDQYKAEWTKEKRLQRAKAGKGHDGQIISYFKQG
jgi:hypothetical protein